MAKSIARYLADVASPTGVLDGTLSTAAQTNVTSLGTLSALTVDNLGINGNTITANSGALNLTPASGSAIVLDGTINVDAGVVTGATSITSTAFVGGLTGNVTGNVSGTAATVTGAAQTNITSLGTLTALTVDNITLNGSTISSGNNGNINFPTASSGNADISFDGSNFTIVSNSSSANLKLQTNSQDALTIAANGTATFASALVTGSTITAGSTIHRGNMTIHSQEIDVGSGDLTLDVAGDIILDADGDGEIFLKDGGTSYGLFYNSNGNFMIYSAGQDKDIFIQGNDGGSTINALTIDMSAAGAATFNSDVTTGGKLTVSDGGNATVAAIRFNAGLGISSPSTDQMNFITADTSRMVIASDGIVTITPDTGATTGTLRLHNGNGNGTLGQIDFGHSGSVHHGSILYTGNMDFHTGASADSRFFIGMNGEVGINTTSPEHHLHVTEPGSSKEDGIVKIGGSAAGLGLELSYNQAGATTTEIVANPTYTNVSSLMRICVDRDANTDQLVLTGGGNVGIGTSAPKRMLQVGDNSQSIAAISLQASSSSGLSRVYMGDNDSTAAEYAGLISYTHSSDDMQFWANGGEMFRLQPNVFSFGGGSTSHGRIRQYHYAVAMNAATTVALLQNNSGAHTDVNFLYWIEAYHSSRTYRTGVGTFGGYGLYTSSAGQGLNFTITNVSTGIKRLDFAASTSYATTVYIGMLILGDTELTVHNGTLGDMI